MINYNQNPFFAEFLIVSACLASLQKFLKGKSDAVRVAHLHSCIVQRAHFQVRVGVKSCNDLFGCFFVLRC